MLTSFLLQNFAFSRQVKELTAKQNEWSNLWPIYKSDKNSLITKQSAIANYFTNSYFKTIFWNYEQFELDYSRPNCIWGRSH